MRLETSNASPETNIKFNEAAIKESPVVKINDMSMPITIYETEINNAEKREAIVAKQHVIIVTKSNHIDAVIKRRI